MEFIFHLSVLNVYVSRDGPTWIMRTVIGFDDENHVTLAKSFDFEPDT